MAEPKLSQVFHLLCCNFVQWSLTIDHHGHHWQDPAIAQPRQKVGARDCAHDGVVEEHDFQVASCALEGAPKYQRAPQDTKLGAFRETLRTALVADSHRARHERRTARAP